MMFSSEAHPMTHGKESNSPLKESSTGMAFPEEIVVFDDIGESWKGEKEKSQHNKSESSGFTVNHTYDLNNIDSDKVAKVIMNCEHSIKFTVSLCT